MPSMNQEKDITSLPAADVHFQSNQKNSNHDFSLKAQLSYSINLMESDKHDAMISLRTSLIKEIKAQLNNMTVKKFPWHEILLGIGLMFLGVVVGSFISQGYTPNIWLWTICPILSVTCLLSYFFLRSREGSENSQIACTILERLPKDNEIQKAENEIR
jgi:hypothetical protein